MDTSRNKHYFRNNIEAIFGQILIISILTISFPLSSLAQSAGGQIKRPQRIKDKSISEKSKVKEIDYSGTDVIRLINQYLKKSKGDNYAIPYEVFINNKSLKEESNRVEMDEDGNYPFAKKYRAQLTIDGKSLGGIWFLALRGPRAGAYIFEMQSSVSVDVMKFIKKSIREKLSGELVEEDTEDVSIHSHYLYRIKNGYILLNFDIGAGQVMANIIVSNMKEIIESEL